MLSISTVCPVNTQEFILRNANLLPETNIEATSEDAINSPAVGFVDTNTAPWCTDHNDGLPGQSNHIVLTFTEPIVLSFFESKGTLQSWVSNFSIQYSLTESGDDFMTYGVLETPQVISAHNTLICT